MSWNISISNVAGIRSGDATIEPSVNAIRGTNWQGKTSFIRAIETAIGTEAVLTEGEDWGHVELVTETETISIDLVRENGTVDRRGGLLLSDEQTRAAAALFAFLDDQNEVRQAVRNHKNLEDVLMRPLDFENIDEKIKNQTRKRDQFEQELEQAQDAANQLPSKKKTVHNLENELDELKANRDELKAQNATETGTDTQRDELSDAKAECDNLENQIERFERSIKRMQNKLDDRRTELDNLEVPEADEDLDAKIADSKEQHRKLEQNAELLQSIYAPTKRILAEERLDLITDVQRNLMEDMVECWTCGNKTTRDEIADSLSRLSDQIEALRSAAAEQKEHVDELQEHRNEYERASRRKAELKSEIEEMEPKLEERETSLERSRERFEEIEARIEDLSEEVQKTDDKLTDLESQIKYSEARLEDARNELESLEARAEQRKQLQTEYEKLTDEIHALRNRKTEIKRRTREVFDDVIQDILSRFDVGFEMVRLTSNFELVVARDGRESSLDALSEGELELLGIVACLAGYEAFDVTDDVPIMLLDGLGSLADENLQTLIEYLSTHVEYIVFTTHPENTQFEGHTIDPAGWSVVSPETDAAAISD